MWEHALVFCCLVNLAMIIPPVFVDKLTVAGIYWKYLDKLSQLSSLHLITTNVFHTIFIGV